MAKLKYTKNELKTQRDSLARFRRYLPTLQLKKQQLQTEVRQLVQKIAEKRAEEDAAREVLSRWVKLFSEPLDLSPYIRITKILVSTGNVVGVAVPVLEGVEYERKTPDLFLTPPWVDAGIRMIEQLMRLRVERKVIEEQAKRLQDELVTTTQRVNLFEKVKIPQCRENIRVICIFLGDQMTAGVARAKIAKGKSLARDSAA